jgi:NAD(P)-dependent dehydrogenase (short-subunit alcohol dehydrogenase family)
MASVLAEDRCTTSSDNPRTRRSIMTTPTKPVALVTGASSGIGEAAAGALVTAGYEVIGTSRDTSRVAARDGVTLLDLDVASDDSVAAAVDHVIARFGRIDLLVNNAGMAAGGAAEESSIAQDQRLFDVNVIGVMRMIKAVLPHMRTQRGGRILNISSIVGLIPAPYLAAYSATKHAIEGYSESLDHEVRQYGIRVLLIEPGWTDTGIEANRVRPDNPLPIYERQSQIAVQIMTSEVKDGDDPATVAKVVVTAATAANPKLRYTAGSMAGRVSTLRRFIPVRAFDRSLRKRQQLPAA